MKEQATMNYKIIQSGSQGNCVVINDVMIDCGVPYKKIKAELYNIRFLLITHVHTDHFDLNTYLKIRKDFPRIKTIGNYEVHQKCGVDYISNSGYIVQSKPYEFLPFDCVHDVYCQGFLWVHEGKSIIYATDTSSLEHAPKIKYDHLFLESNHDEKKLELAINERKGDYSPFSNGMRHLSTQKCKTFYYLNRRGRNSELIELHKSDRFY